MFVTIIKEGQTQTEKSNTKKITYKKEHYNLNDQKILSKTKSTEIKKSQESGVHVVKEDTRKRKCRTQKLDLKIF